MTQHSKIHLKAWFFWLLGTSCYFYQFVFRTVFGTMGPEITTGFNITAAELSTFFSISMLCYAVMQVPAGMLLDTFGPRRMLTMAMTCLGGGLFLVGYTQIFMIALIGRALMGIGAAFAFVGTSKLVIMWFPVHMMGFLLGVTVFIGSIAGAFSQHIIALFSTSSGWRSSVMIMGAMGVLLSTIIFSFVREKKLETKSENQDPDSFIHNLQNVIKNKQILLVALWTFFAYLPISILGDSWGPLACEKLFNVSRDVANQAISYFYIPFALGALFFSALSEWFKARHILIVETLLTLIGVYVFVMLPQIGSSSLMGIPVFLLLCAFIGFSIGGLSLAFPLGCAHAPASISGTVVGYINMWCMISGSIVSKIIGGLLAWQWDGTRGTDGSPIYSALSYQNAFMLLILAMVISFGLLLMIKERKTFAKA